MIIKLRDGRSKFPLLPVCISTVTSHGNHSTVYPMNYAYGSSFVLLTCGLVLMDFTYDLICNISCTLVGNKIVDHSDVIGASPVGATPITSLCST